MKGARKGKSPEIIKTDVASPELYKYYISTLGDTDKQNGFKVSIGTFNKVTKEFNKILYSKVIFNPKGIVLPYRLGRLQILKYKTPVLKKDDSTIFTKHIPIDWNATLALWEKDEISKKNKLLVRRLNKHTDGYVYECKWDKWQCNIPNRTVYFFRPTRVNKLFLAKELMKEEREVDYYEITKYKKQWL